MTTGTMQFCLARLYADESFRRSFNLDPSAALAPYELTAEERRALEGIERGKLEFFASSLLSKRRRRFERVYRLLFGLSGPEVDEACARFHQLHPLRPGGSVEVGGNGGETGGRPADSAGHQPDG